MTAMDAGGLYTQNLFDVEKRLATIFYSRHTKI